MRSTGADLSGDDAASAVQHNPRRTQARSGYLATLDGWRAIAILVVMVGHAPTVRLGPISTTHFHFLGDFGVDIFFAISGLLICSRLLDEEELTGSLHLKGFYIRRLFRIQPPALLYLAVIVVLTILHRVPNMLSDLIASLCLIRNYIGMKSIEGWVTAHYWSLSVEEHFYLILPSLLLFVKHRRARVLLGLALISFCWRVYLAHTPATNVFYIRVRTDTCICLLLLPAGLAVLLRRERFKRLASRYAVPLVVFPVVLFLLPDHNPLHDLEALMPPLMVMSTMLHPAGLLGRLLESAPLRFIGRISYSLYLWQELFLTANYVPSIHPFGWLHTSALVWPCIFMVSIASYYWIEKPFIRLGHRLAKPATAGRPI